MKRLLSLVLIAIVTVGILVSVGKPTLATPPVPICSGLKLYGNAAYSGLCKSLSPATQTNWVCELSGSNPDVHTTFNAGESNGRDATLLHLTVRTPSKDGKQCEGNSNLGGNWPNGLALGDGEQNNICGVDLNNYVKRLNSVPEEFKDCTEAFNKAQEKGRINESVKNSYIQKCKQYCK